MELPNVFHTTLIRKFHEKAHRRLIGKSLRPEKIIEGEVELTELADFVLSTWL